MAHVSNFVQTNDKIILDLINASNTTELPQTAITLGAPTAAQDDPTGLITTVVATAASGSGYSGTQTFTYNRVDLGFMQVNEPGFVIETDATSMHGVLDALNTMFGIQLTAADVEDTAIPTLEANVDTPVTLTATAGSLVWAKSVSVTLTKPLVTLASVLTVTTLDGLYAPEPVSE